MKPFCFNITIDDSELFQEQLLNWAQQFKVCALFNSNQYPNYPYAKNDFILAVDATDTITDNNQNPWSNIQNKLDQNPNWWYGFLSYDLKNSIEELSSKNEDLIKIPDYFFFSPRWIFSLEQNNLKVYSDFPIDEKLILDITCTKSQESKYDAIRLQPRITQTQYIKTIDKIIEHIKKGDIYEINFCQEYFAKGKEINPLLAYLELNRISKAPFSCFLKIEDKYLISSSPERFLKKEGQKVISQPIKGTAKRGKDPLEDQKIKLDLQQSLKDTTENIMIVDLVRNDLSKNSIPGTVKVEELNQVYTFKQVHQLISTISAQIEVKTPVTQVIKDAFPMGSMTGAPKVMAMKLIEQYEATKRGLFSGAVGYFDPDGNFDFNVIIRSILYNSTLKNTSVQVGGAITYDSDSQKEYAECLIKADAMRKVLER